MDVIHYKDQADIWFREIIARNYGSLRKLEEEYRKLGKQTFFNIYDMCAGQWILTVRMGHSLVGGNHADR